MRIEALLHKNLSHRLRHHVRKGVPHQLDHLSVLTGEDVDVGTFVNLAQEVTKPAVDHHAERSARQPRADRGSDIATSGILGDFEAFSVWEKHMHRVPPWSFASGDASV